MTDIKEVQTWLTNILGEEVDWEINPQSLEVLKRLKENNIQQEKHAQVILEEAERSRQEYEAETKRLASILSELGLTEKSLSGPSSAYIEVLTECCSLLNEDNIGSGLEAGAARLLVNQADLIPELSKAKEQLEGVKAATLKLYSQLDRLEDAVQLAEKEGAEDKLTVRNQTKKLDFLLAKEKEYKTNIDKDEANLTKIMHKEDPSGALSHARVVEVEAEWAGLDQQLEEARRQITGYLNLPPSLDLARVEIAKAERELASLTEQVNNSISSFHL
eukprot:TRINITY_DN9190_c0_g1_i1.p1 TRINITY_DN9190_c0_g1~~TRINITY_DN9190_c0_g1_i1.p1  ORF type:complete len:275 (-),score=84.48 TRINITY_DN9190_c0_g1_i1:368-1192(-)